MKLHRSYIMFVRYCSHVSLHLSVSMSIVTHKEIFTTLRMLLVNNFPHIPFLPLVSANTCEVLCSKGHFMSLKTIVHEFIKIAMNQSHSFCSQTSCSSLLLFKSLKNGCNNLPAVFVKI